MVGRRIETRCENEHGWKQDVAVCATALPAKDAAEKMLKTFIENCPVCGKRWTRIRSIGFVAMYGFD